MRRREFLRNLKEQLRKRRDIEVEEVLFYYDELIQDAVDNGEDEEIFIMNLGSIKDITRRIEDDEEFVAEVKDKNIVVVKNVLSISVKIIGYTIFGILGFALFVTCISLFFSGIAVIFAAVGRALFSAPADLYGYVIILGAILIGASLTLLSVGLFKWFTNQANPALLSIFRKINDFSSKRGKN
ncbi:DUF1700 domain-containing protein [Mycoplasmatota bacterium WC30]